jgi:hypothetical protein
MEPTRWNVRSFRDGRYRESCPYCIYSSALILSMFRLLGVSLGRSTKFSKGLVASTRTVQARYRLHVRSKRKWRRETRPKSSVKPTKSSAQPLNVSESITAATYATKNQRGRTNNGRGAGYIESSLQTEGQYQRSQGGRTKEAGTSESRFGRSQGYERREIHIEIAI